MAKKHKRKVMGRDSWQKHKEEEEAKRKSGGSPIHLPEGVEWLEVKEAGRRYLDLLPYEVTDKNRPDGVPAGSMYYVRPFGLHRSVGPDEARVICPKATWGEKCPICEEQQRLWEARADSKVTGALRPKQRALYLVIDQKDPEQKVRAYEGRMWAGKKIPDFGIHLENEIKYQDDSEKVPWDWDGPTLQVTFDESDFDGTKWYPATQVVFKDMGKDVDEDVVEGLHMDEWFVHLTYQEIDAMFQGDTDAVPPEVEKPEPRERAAKVSRRREPEPDPEDEGDGGGEDEPGDEDKGPSINTPAAARKYLENWDADEVDFDDDDEVRKARKYLLAAAETAGVDMDELPSALTGKNNNTEKGLKKLHGKLVAGLPEEKPAGKKGKDKPKTGKNKDPECPHGYTFGSEADWLEHGECESCEVETACGEAAS